MDRDETNESLMRKRSRGRPPLPKGLKCLKCGTTDTPEWRLGENGPHTLCNACGLQYAKKKKWESESKAKHSIKNILNSNEEPSPPPLTQPNIPHLFPDQHQPWVRVTPHIEGIPPPLASPSPSLNYLSSSSSSSSSLSPSSSLSSYNSSLTFSSLSSSSSFSPLSPSSFSLSVGSPMSPSSDSSYTDNPLHHVRCNCIDCLNGPLGSAGHNSNLMDTN